MQSRVRRMCSVAIGSNILDLPTKNRMKWSIKAIKTIAQRLGTLSPNCKEAARLQSAALDRRLTLLESFGLRCHLVLCKWCCRYARQLKFLRSAAREHAHDDQHSLQPVLSCEARERIKQKLQSEKE
jgi:hypothetical protein